jgi:hypothetical protein
VSTNNKFFYSSYVAQGGTFISVFKDIKLKITLEIWVLLKFFDVDGRIRSRANTYESGPGSGTLLLIVV